MSEYLSNSLAGLWCVLDEAFQCIIWAVPLVLIFEFRVHGVISYDKFSVFILDLGPLGINSSLLEILMRYCACRLWSWSWIGERFIRFDIDERILMIDVIDIYKFGKFSGR